MTTTTAQPQLTTYTMRSLCLALGMAKHTDDSTTIDKAVKALDQRFQRVRQELRTKDIELGSISKNVPLLKSQIIPLLESFRGGNPYALDILRGLESQQQPTTTLRVTTTTETTTDHTGSKASDTITKHPQPTTTMQASGTTQSDIKTTTIEELKQQAEERRVRLAQEAAQQEAERQQRIANNELQREKELRQLELDHIEKLEQQKLELERVKLDQRKEANRIVLEQQANQNKKEEEARKAEELRRKLESENLNYFTLGDCINYGLILFSLWGYWNGLKGAGVVLGITLGLFDLLTILNAKRKHRRGSFGFGFAVTCMIAIFNGIFHNFTFIDMFSDVKEMPTYFNKNALTILLSIGVCVIHLAALWVTRQQAKDDSTL